MHETDALPLRAGGIVAVAGVSYRQPVLERLALFGTTTAQPYLEELEGDARDLVRNGEKLWFRASLVPELDNPHDSNAIGIEAGGELLGYLAREAAVDYSPVMAEVRRLGYDTASCPAKLTGGDDRWWGVALALSAPELVVARLRGD